MRPLDPKLSRARAAALSAWKNSLTKPPVMGEYDVTPRLASNVSSPQKSWVSTQNCRPVAASRGANRGDAGMGMGMGMVPGSGAMPTLEAVAVSKPTVGARRGMGIGMGMDMGMDATGAVARSVSLPWSLSSGLATYESMNRKGIKPPLALAVARGGGLGTFVR
jgi:hypothetical protein